MRDMPHLDAGSAHVWRIPLDRAEDAMATSLDVLSADESARAARFFFEKDRRSFLRCRSTLRVLLGRYLRTDPHRLEFCYNGFGKPELAVLPPMFPLRFNVSHSGAWALIAMTLEHRIGVDVEQVRQLENIDDLARNSFSKVELDVYQHLPGEQRTQAFFHAWTRKEAFIKACGEGLSRPLTDFDVSLAPQDPVQVLQVAGDPTAARRWTLSALEPAVGCVGAVAVERPDTRIQCFAEF
jgi:4'-phosphopantetheinyl transferase